MRTHFAGKKLSENQLKDNILVQNILSKNRKARILLKKPTGVGKTISVGNILANKEIQDILLAGTNRNKLRVVFKAHVNRLLYQAKTTYDIENFHCILNFDYWRKNKNPLTDDHNIEILYQSYNDKIPDDVDIDITILEEGHHEATKTIQEFLEIGAKYPIIGLSADDKRADQFLIKFDHIVETITRQEAVDAGIICETDIISIVDVSHKNKLDLAKDVFSNYIEYFNKTLIFANTKKDALLISEHISSLGYKSLAILNQSNDEINKILNDFENDEYQFIASCKKLSEGIDVPSVADIFIMQQIGTENKLNQCIGRGARMGDPRCTVWEMVNPLSGDNLDATAIVGIPKSHKLLSKKKGQWIMRDMIYEDEKSFV